ncbi:MAG: heptosyltransferase, partial [Deltaproteobacteria bacterium]|nr:heptosyltransferase [Deltaproteobacteria bacterium]
MKMSLVLQLARLGDLLQTKRLLLTLAAEGETHLVVDASLAPLAALLYPGVEVHALPAHAGGLDAAGVLRLACKACAELSALPCDKVYNLNRSPLNLALAGLFAPEKVVGYRLENGQALASTWACMAARWTGKRRISPLNLMDFWAFFHPSPWPADQVNPEAKAKSPSGYAGQRVGVALAGREARRSLPPPVLAETLKMVFAQYKGPTLVLLGGETEQAKARLLLKCLPPAMQSKTENLCGKTALTD